MWGAEAVTTRKRACAAGDEEKFSTKTRTFLMDHWLGIGIKEITKERKIAAKPERSRMLG